MILRLKIFIPITLILVLCFAGFYFFKDGLLKIALESTVSGLSIQNDSINFSDNVEIQLGAVLNDDPTKSPLFSFEEAKASLNLKALGFAKIDCPQLILKNVIIDKRIGENIAEESNKQIEAIDKTLESNQSGPNSLPNLDFKNMGAREVLERITGNKTLKSEASLKALEDGVKKITHKWTGKKELYQNTLQNIKKQTNQISNKWKNPPELLALKNKATQLKNEFQQFQNQKFNFSNIAQIPQTLTQLNQLKTNSNQLIKGLKSLETNIKKDADFFNKMRTEIKKLKGIDRELQKDKNLLETLVQNTRVAALEDKAMLKEELNIKNFGAQKITRLLFGKEWETTLVDYLSKWDAVKKWLPKMGFENDTSSNSNTPTNALEQNIYPEVIFQREPMYASWAFRHIEYKGNTQSSDGHDHIDFQGTIDHLSSNEAILGKPTEWQLSGTIGTNQTAWEVNGKYSQLQKNKTHRYMNFSIKEKSLKGKNWGKGETEVIFNQGNMAININLDLSNKNKITGIGTIFITNASIHAGPNVKDIIKSSLQQAITKMLESPIAFNFSYEIQNRDLDLKINNELDDLFKNILKGTIDNLVSENKLKVIQHFDEQLKAKLNQKVSNPALKQVVTSIQQNILGSLAPETANVNNAETIFSSSLQNIQTENKGLQTLLSNSDLLLNNRKALKEKLIKEQKERLRKIAENKVKAEQEKLKKRAAAELAKKLNLQRAEELKKENLKKELERKKLEEIERLKKKAEDEAKKKLEDKLKDKFKKFGF